MNYHLVILVHGLWGNLSHFNYVQSQLELAFNQDPDQKERLFVYKTGSNEGYKTYDGIDLCGKRVASEIESQILHLNGHEGKVVKISVIGYSLGGLIARYAIGILYYKGYFRDIEPVNFCSLCSPHVGTLTPGKGVSIQFFNWAAPLLIGNSGKQVFLKDKTKVSNHMASSGISRTNSSHSLSDTQKQQEYQPLLVLMSNPASVFFKGLKLFKHKSLYSNVVNDKRTSWWTSGISIMNPFEVLDVDPTIKIDSNGVIDFRNGTKFKFSFQEDYKPVILDSSKPLKILNHLSNVESGESEVLSSTFEKNEREELVSNKEITIAADYAENFFRRKFKWVIVIFNIVIYGPMWFILFVLTSVVERTKSGIRVLKESDAGSFLELYHLVDDESEEKKTDLLRPSLSRSLSETYDNIENKLEQNLQDQTEELLESVWDAMMSKKIHNEEDQFWFNKFEGDMDKQDETPAFVTSLEELANGKYRDESSTLSSSRSPDRLSVVESVHHMLDNFKLNFNTDAQLEIIKNLNTLNWKKMPMYIQLTDHTHAAAIVRHKDVNFREGEVVVRHLCNEVFQLN